jgi:hypothetical protein
MRLRTYKDWDGIRQTGRGGKKKIRRDTTLAIRPDGVLTFTYDDKNMLATLDDHNTFTLYWDDEWGYYPTHANIFRIIAGLTVYRDVSHYKNYKQPLRVGGMRDRFMRTDDGKWVRAKNTIPLTTGLQYRAGVCLNPEIAVDYKRKLNREKSLPWLRKTEVLAKVLRVATRMQLLVRERAKQEDFENVNIEDPMAKDAEIILNRGRAMGMYGWRYNHASPEEHQAALLRCAENGLADYREWLYLKQGCYEMVPIVYSTDEGAKQ